MTIPTPRPSAVAPKASDPGSGLAKARASDQSAAAKARATAPAAAPPRTTTASSSSSPTYRAASPPPTVRVDPSYASTRPTRASRVYVYRDYGTWHYHGYNDDHLNPMLTGFLLAKLSEPGYSPHTSRYIYHHWDEFGPTRREELLRENSGLRAQLAAYEAQGLRRDASYVMPGLDADLAYNDSSAQSLYRPASSFDFGQFLLWTGIGVAFIVIVYVVLFKNYDKLRA